MKLGKVAQPNHTLALQISGILLLLVSVLFGRNHEQDYMFSFLTHSFFWLSIILGGLFFVMLHHITSARWSIVVRRVAEQIANLIPWLAVLMIPALIFGMKDLFPWAKPEALHDHLIMKKASYLNANFFTVRVFVYFAIWIFLAGALSKLSLKQDQTGSQKEMATMKALSAGGIFFFGLTLTFASFDWIMSLDPHWYSTIFGLYVFAGSAVAIMSTLILVCLFVQRNGLLENIMTIEHYHDMGKLLFAFICFWAYMAFSQYFLIWYANIPEETVWYAHRGIGSWKSVSLFLALGHFAIPFVGFMSRTMKRNKYTLIFFSVWMLVLHLIDLHWLIGPNLHHHGIHISWMDFFIFGGFTLFLTGRLLVNLNRVALYPSKDPLIKESIHFKNH